MSMTTLRGMNLIILAVVVGWMVPGVNSALAARGGDPDWRLERRGYDEREWGQERTPMRREYRPRMSEADRELKEEIESELAWSPFVDAENIRVSVRNGVATLRGTVEDEDEREAAIENAYEAGADRVKTQLRILRDADEFFDGGYGYGYGYPYYGYPYYYP